MTAADSALVIGGSGYIGQRLLLELGRDKAVGTFCRNRVDGGVRFDATKDRLRDLLASRPARVTHVFILHGNVAIEACAHDPVGTAEANVAGTIRIIDDAIAAGALPIYASTDYVLGDRGAWREHEATAPQTAYGLQKQAVERYLSGLAAPWIAARLSKVVGCEPDRQSVLGQWAEDIKAQRTLRLARDQIFSPAWVGDVAAVLAKLSTSPFRGLINVAGPVAYSRLALAELLLSRIKTVAPGITADIVPISLHDLPFLERRPLNTSLDTQLLAATIAHRFRAMPDLCDHIADTHFSDRDAAFSP